MTGVAFDLPQDQSLHFQRGPPLPIRALGPLDALYVDGEPLHGA
jgi:hypothetical protein